MIERNRNAASPKSSAPSWSNLYKAGSCARLDSVREGGERQWENQSLNASYEWGIGWEGRGKKNGDAANAKISLIPPVLHRCAFAPGSHRGCGPAVKPISSPKPGTHPRSGKEGHCAPRLTFSSPPLYSSPISPPSLFCKSEWGGFIVSLILTPSISFLSAFFIPLPPRPSSACSPGID